MPTGLLALPLMSAGSGKPLASNPAFYQPSWLPAIKVACSPTLAPGRRVSGDSPSAQHEDALAPCPPAYLHSTCAWPLGLTAGWLVLLGHELAAAGWPYATKSRIPQSLGTSYPQRPMLSLVMRSCPHLPTHYSSISLAFTCCLPLLS